MRILYYHRTLGDGAEGIHIREMVQALQERGHEVCVTGPVGEPRASAPRHDSALAGIARLIPTWAYEGAEMVYDAFARLALAREVRRFRPDVLYDRYNVYSTAAVATARGHRIPVLVEFNTVAYERIADRHHRLRLPWLANRYERWVCHAADHVFAVSTPLALFLNEQHGLPMSRVTVLPNGANAATFTPRDDTAAREELRVGNAVVIGFVGILRPWHGVDLFLDAIADLLARGHNVHALIVGDGPIEPALRALARQRHIGKHVTFTGRVAHDRVRDYVAAMDVTVSPRTTFYASPMKILEYMAMGKPVIAPALDNIRDLITDGCTGLLFRPDDRQDLIRRLEELLQSPHRRATIGQAARAAIEQHRNWRVNAQVVEATAQRLLGERGRATRRRGGGDPDKLGKEV
jgi:glycosyltransferase involved in cell wall biosynthesis